MARPGPRLWPVSIAVVIGTCLGGAVLWLQAGLVGSIGSLAWGSWGFQSHLSAAAEGVTGEGYEVAIAQYRAADDSASRVAASADSSQIDAIARVPGITTAVSNWKQLASAMSDITSTTGEMLSLYGELSGKEGGAKIFSDGAINIPQLNSLPPRVSAAQAALTSAEADLRSIQADTKAARLLDLARDKALTEMRPVQRAVAALVDLAPLLPDALGAKGPRRYLVAIGNQAEMRASGGAPLTLVMVEFDNGRITIPIKGQTSTQLFPPLNAPVEWWGPRRNPFFKKNPRDKPFVVTNTHPSLLFSGREMAGAWQGGGYPAVDGIVTLDLTAIAAVLQATGPVPSEAYGLVDGAKLGQILLVDAYANFGQEEAATRQLANQQLLDELLTRLLSGDELVNAAQAIASTAPGRHFQVWMENPAFEQLALDSGASGQVSDPGTGDWSAMYTQNGNQSKVDVFQQRNVSVSVQLSDDGSAQVTQQMTVANATPTDRPEGPPERIGYETMWLKAAYLMYVPDAAVDYAVDYPEGFLVRPFKGHIQLGRGWVDDGFGHKLIRVVGWTAPGGQATVGVSYRLPAGTFATDVPGRLAYTLQAEPQSLWNNSVLTVSVTAPRGWSPVPQGGMNLVGSTLTASAVQDAPVNVTMEFIR